MQRSIESLGAANPNRNSWEMFRFRKALRVQTLNETRAHSAFFIKLSNTLSPECTEMFEKVQKCVQCTVHNTSKQNSEYFNIYEMTDSQGVLRMIWS